MDMQKTKSEPYAIDRKMSLEVDSSQFYLEEMQRMNNQLIDAQRELNRALKVAEDAKREKEQLFAAMSHDIRIPLNSICGMTAMALDDFNNAVFVKESLATIQNASEYLISIVNDILDLGKMEHQNFLPEEENFCISDEIEEIKKLMLPTFQEKEQRFICELSDAEGYLLGSRLSIRRVIINLLSNASKYTQNEGNIVLNINVRSGGNLMWMNISVRDNGMGMSEEQLQYLFTPYFRTNRKEVKMIQGTGLGLTIVKRYVEVCNGKIQVESKEGEGSTFYISIPVKPGTEPETFAYIGKNRKENSASACYLLCEDNAINTRIVRHLLEKKDCQMDAATNGKEGVKLFGQNPGKYRAVFMDMNMPVMGGLEAAKKIRSIDPDILIVALSGDESPEMMEQEKEVGVNLHLRKPIDVHKFYEIIK